MAARINANGTNGTNGHANGAAGSRKKVEDEFMKNAKVQTIVPLRICTATFLIEGISKLVQHRFGQKAREQIIATQEAGSTAKKGKKREPKDFKACYEEARHIAKEGWDGIHAAGFRHALIDACKIVGFHMTKAKLAIFVVADGYERDGTPLVRITRGEPHMEQHPVRNDNGAVDIRARPMWDEGWQAFLTIEYDSDMFSAADIANLVQRAGRQCGIGEGRPNSKDSVGCGWGMFKVATGRKPSDESPRPEGEKKSRKRAASRASVAEPELAEVGAD